MVRLTREDLLGMHVGEVCDVSRTGLAEFRSELTRVRSLVKRVQTTLWGRWSCRVVHFNEQPTFRVTRIK